MCVSWMEGGKQMVKASEEENRLSIALEEENRSSIASEEKNSQ